MIPFISRPRPDVTVHDDDVTAGFAPRCPCCGIMTQPHSSRDHAWWRCPECALPVLG